MSDFGKFSDYNKDANFSMVKFGGGVKIIEAELNEAQQIIIGKLKDLITHQIGEGVYLDNNMTYNGGTFTIGDTFAVVGGNLIYISSLSISATDGQDIYLDIHEDELAFGDTLNRYGNEQETEIDNKILDMRLGTETTRRMGVKYNLSTSNGVAGHTYLKLGSISGSVFTSSVKTLTTNDNIQQNIDIARDIAKQYTDSQIATVTSTGIPKLVSYPYDLYATTDNQTVFEIPYDYFTNATDTLMVFFDGIFRPTTDYVITNPIEVEGVITKGYITLSVGRPIDSYVGLMILKNVPIGEDGSIRGGVIAVDSLPQDRVTGLVETLNNLSTFNTTTDGRLDDIEGELLDATITTPTISYGMNSKITNTGKTSVSPKFTIQGKTVINLLGKDGNCEDVSKWTDYQCTHALDTSNKIFGNNGIKVTLTSTSCAMYKHIENTIDKTKYYCLSGYVKNGNAININLGILSASGGTNKYNGVITDDTKFTRSFGKFQPSDFGTSTDIEVQVLVTGTSGQYAYVDGIMLEEITQAQYNDSNFTPSPYVDSYSCLRNPYIEIRHDNLVRNGNGEEGVSWWTPTHTDGSVTFSIDNGKYKLVTTDTFRGVYQLVNVKPNTNYYVKGNVSRDDTSLPYVKLKTADGLTNLVDISLFYTIGGYTFNSGDNSVIRIPLQNTNAGTGYFDSIILTEGTEPPTEYLPCRIERTVIEGNFTSDDSLTYDNGEVSGLINWKHKTLFGKDYDWIYNSDFTGFKAITIISLDKNADGNNFTHIKYNGKITNKLSSGWNNSDITQIEGNGNFTLSIADTDTGFNETIAPNNDEVKAFMNGWKAINNNGTRYTSWISIIDSSMARPVTPVGTNNAGQPILNVSDGSIFATNDWIYIRHDDGTAQNYQISSINVNALTFSGNLAKVVSSSGGGLLQRCDNGSTNTSLLNYCKNNIAPNYEGYQLHYKLANPEPITDVNTSISGDIPKFDIGDNYLYLDSGIVLGEVANPVLSGDSYYRINSKFSNTSATFLKNKAELIYLINKNGSYNPWNITIGADINVNGNSSANLINTSFDTNATYTVDYKILATQAPQIGSIGCSYSQDIVSAIIDLNEKVENRQQHDSILDNIIDLSVYELIKSNWTFMDVYTYNTRAYVSVTFPMSIKKVTPNFTIQNDYKIMIGSSTGSYYATDKFELSGIEYWNNRVRCMFTTTDSTTISNIRQYGCQIYQLNIIADCRGRI